MKLQKPKGTQDILPQESVKWQYVEEFARKTFKKYHYAESDNRREALTREPSTSSILEKQSNEDSHSSNNPKQSVEAVNATTSVAPEKAAGSSNVEKEVGSNTGAATNLNPNTTNSGER